MIVIQRAVSARGVPSPSRLRQWARAALEGADGELTVRIVGEKESRSLNRRYRGKDKPTNVLSFAYEALTPPTAPRSALPSPAKRERDGGAAHGRKHVRGDLVICAPVVNREARDQRKPAVAHWAHMVVHGVLHLRGYDHVRPRDAQKMEARERAVLGTFGFPDPYISPERAQTRR